MVGPINDKVKEEKKVAINGNGLFLLYGRKRKYGLFLWDGGSIYYVLLLYLDHFYDILMQISIFPFYHLKEVDF